MIDKDTILERIDALQNLVADEESKATLTRIEEALQSGLQPTPADMEHYNDLWETFGEDTEAS